MLTTLLFFAIQGKKIVGLDARIADFDWEVEPKDRAMTFAPFTSMTRSYDRPEAPDEAHACYAVEGTKLMLNLSQLAGAAPAEWINT